MNKEYVTRSDTCEAKILCEDSITQASLTARYRLYRVSFDTSCYFVEVRMARECEVAYIGDKETSAMTFYRYIRDGFVTPCTLQAVVEDLRESFW